jgi:hypothetical protein
MDEARTWLYNVIMRRVQQTSGAEYTIVVAPRERPRTVIKPLDDGSRLEVELSWAGDAPRVVSAVRIFVVEGAEMPFRLPPDLIRLAVARARPGPADDLPE